MDAAPPAGTRGPHRRGTATCAHRARGPTSQTARAIANVLNKVPPFPTLGEQGVRRSSTSAGRFTCENFSFVDLDGGSMPTSRRRRDPSVQVTVPVALGPPVGARAWPPPGYVRGSPARRDRRPATTPRPRDREIRSPSARAVTSYETSPLKPRSRSRSRAPLQRSHRHRTPPPSDKLAAEIQQNLWPPRIARVGGAKPRRQRPTRLRDRRRLVRLHRKPPRHRGSELRDPKKKEPPPPALARPPLEPSVPPAANQTTLPESLLAMPKVLLDIGNGATTSTATIGTSDFSGIVVSLGHGRRRVTPSHHRRRPRSSGSKANFSPRWEA